MVRMSDLSCGFQERTKVPTCRIGGKVPKLTEISEKGKLAESQLM